MLFHDQQARSAGFNRESGAIKRGKRRYRKFDRRTALCHTVMTLRKVFAKQAITRQIYQLALRKLAGATRTATGLLRISISTMTRRSPSAIW